MSDERDSLDDTLLLRNVAPADVIELASGAVFAGRYRVDTCLGQGGMGVVYRVHDLELDESVALKIMTLPDAAADRQFVDEVRLARRVTHRHAARTHDIGLHEGIRFLTMELVAGRSLEEILADGKRLPPERAARLAGQVAEGLAAAHDAGVIHRDLKPANIIVAPGDHAMITDFGLAHAVNSPNDESGGDARIVGTPAYMSPEQALGLAVDARSDVYSLGLLLYEMLTGHLPFDGDDFMQILRARIEHSPAPPSQHAEVPPELADLVMWLLSRDPEGRPDSATSVREALTAYIDEQHPASTPFAPLGANEHALAVLPFRYRGPADHNYIGEGLAEELIDTLSRTRGLKVWSLGATQRFVEDRDPKHVSQALGADSVVDGTLQLVGDRVRLTARLLSGDGIQRWSERFDVLFVDVLSLQDTLSRRLAETLRLEVSAVGVDQPVPTEATQLYLRARHVHRSEVVLPDGGVVSMLERCLELAPSFRPAIAALAMATARASWFERVRDEGRLERRAQESLAIAEREASIYAETHLARGMLASYRGDYRDAVSALLRALEIAPTFADAHLILGNLQVEAKRVEEGTRRLELSLELDPQLNVSRITLARVHAILGNDAKARVHLDELVKRAGQQSPVEYLRARVAMYRGDHQSVARHFGNVMATDADDAITVIMLPIIELAMGNDLRAASVRSMLANLESFVNPRFRALLGQIGVEALAYTSHYPMALEMLDEIASEVLADLTWLEHCPVLAPLRDMDQFSISAAKVRHRAGSMWLSHGTDPWTRS